MAYTLSNKCAKNLCKWTVLLQLIIKNVVTCFFGTQCSCGFKENMHIILPSHKQHYDCDSRVFLRGAAINSCCNNDK